MDCTELVAAKIRRYRDETKISREEFAHLCRISTRHLNDIENMLCAPTTDMLTTLGAAIGIVFIAHDETDLKYCEKKKQPGVPYWKQFETIKKE